MLLVPRTPRSVCLKLLRTGRTVPTVPLFLPPTNLVPLPKACPWKPLNLVDRCRHPLPRLLTIPRVLLSLPFNPLLVASLPLLEEVPLRVLDVLEAARLPLVVLRDRPPNLLLMPGPPPLPPTLQRPPPLPEQPLPSLNKPCVPTVAPPKPVVKTTKNRYIDTEKMKTICASLTPVPYYLDRLA